ncbi:MAG: class I SAM-dependent methyltransferase [Thermodesulfobacteriota bacterium]
MPKKDRQSERQNGIYMEEDHEYKRQLDLFVRFSTEKGIELTYIGEILAGLKERRDFLDVGAGGGDLTIPLSQTFKRTAVVEPNQEQIDYFRRRCPDFSIFEDDFQTVDLENRLFDFILCSHVLYYVPEGAWTEWIDKMYRHLRPGGSLALVLQSPMGEVSDFFNAFTSYDVNILGLWQNLIHKYGDKEITVRYFANEIWTENLEDLTDIGLFLLIDSRFRRKREEIRDYFEKNHSVPGGYRLRQDVILLAVKKTDPA